MKCCSCDEHYDKFISVFLLIHKSRSSGRWGKSLFCISVIDCNFHSNQIMPFCFIVVEIVNLLTSFRLLFIQDYESEPYVYCRSQDSSNAFFSVYHIRTVAAILIDGVFKSPASFYISLPCTVFRGCYIFLNQKKKPYYFFSVTLGST